MSTKIKFTENYKFSIERGEYIKRFGFSSVFIAFLIICFAAILRGTVNAPHPPPWSIYIIILLSTFVVLGFILPYIADLLPSDIIFHQNKIEIKRVSIPFYLLGVMVYGNIIKSDDILEISFSNMKDNLTIKTKNRGNVIMGLKYKDKSDMLITHIRNNKWKCKIS